MYATERQAAIEDLLDKERRVAVVDVARRFAVTTETVRRDLAVLEERGLITRVHGGAIAAPRSSVRETAIAERVREHSAAKRAIAESAVSTLGEGFRGSILLDAGSTTAAAAALLPEYLRRTDGRADVVTHSFALAPHLAGAHGVDLSIVGGRVRGVTAAAVGASTVAAISTLRPDIALIGANGLSATFGLSTPDPEEAAVKTAIVRAARRVIAVCDASKFGRELLVAFAVLDDIDVLVTDAEPDVSLAAALADAHVEVIVA